MCGSLSVLVSVAYPANPAARVGASVSYEVGESAEGAPEVAVEILWVGKLE